MGSIVGSRDLEAFGVLQEINRLLLHPLGLIAEPDGDSITVYKASLPVYSEPSAGRAATIAGAIEVLGHERIKQYGWVIQPVSSEAKQLTVRVLETENTGWIGAPGEWDEGEEQC